VTRYLSAPDVKDGVPRQRVGVVGAAGTTRGQNGFTGSGVVGPVDLEVEDLGRIHHVLERPHRVVTRTGGVLDRLDLDHGSQSVDVAPGGRLGRQAALEIQQAVTIVIGGQDSVAVALAVGHRQVSETGVEASVLEAEGDAISLTLIIDRLAVAGAERLVGGPLPRAHDVSRRGGGLGGGGGQEHFNKNHEGLAEV